MTSMEGVRIAVVTTAHPWGDPRVFERGVASCLEWGMEVHVFGAWPSQPERKGWSLHPNLHIHLLPAAKGRLGRMLGALSVWREVKAQGPFHAVHFHDPELIPAMVFLGLLKPDWYLCFDIHEELPLQLESKAYLAPVVRRSLGHLARWGWRVIRPLFQGFAAATGPIAAYWPSESTTLVRNFPKSVFGTQAEATPSNGLRILYVGGLSHERGTSDLIEAIRMLLPEFPELMLELVGPVVVKGTVEDLIAQAVAEGWCTHIPWLVPEALAKHCLGATIGVAPLRPQPNYLEALPTKVFEYMAMGIPVVATDLPALRDLVEAPGAGLLAQPTPEGLAKALRRALSSPQDRARFAEVGKRLYRDHYRWEAERQHLYWHFQRAALHGGAA
jgi:glycosyltransferase involved in cell wall biosynthesis